MSVTEAQSLLSTLKKITRLLDDKAASFKEVQNVLTNAVEHCDVFQHDLIFRFSQACCKSFENFSPQIPFFTTGQLDKALEIISKFLQNLNDQNGIYFSAAYTCLRSLVKTKALIIFEIKELEVLVQSLSSAIVPEAVKIIDQSINVLSDKGPLSPCIAKCINNTAMATYVKMMDQNMLDKMKIACTKIGGKYYAAFCELTGSSSIIKKLISPNEKERLAAIRNASNKSSTDEILAVLSRYTDTSPSVRVSVVTLAKKFANIEGKVGASVKDVCMQLMKDPNANVRFAALELCIELSAKDPSMTAEITKRIRDVDIKVCGRAIKFLSKDRKSAIKNIDSLKFASRRGCSEAITALRLYSLN